MTLTLSNFTCLKMSNIDEMLAFKNVKLYSNNKERDTMIYPSIDRLLNVVTSKYELVHIAARRSKEMTNEEHYQLRENEYKCQKNIGRALEEVLEGKLKITEQELH